MKFNMDIIQERGAGYRGIVSREAGRDVEFVGKTWQELRKAAFNEAGIALAARKHFKFYKLSDFETIAGVDASHVRPDCRVSMRERKNGWKRWNF